MAQAAIRKSYEGVVACVPVTVPYRRYSTNSAHWWIGRALHDLVKRAGIRPSDIDGFCVSSFTVGPDTAVGLTQHFGLTPRWLDHIPFGGASGIVALRRAARAVQAGDADIVAVVAGDTNHVDSFRKTLSTFSRFAQDAVYPYGSGGANASFALITKNYMNMYGAKREDFGKLCVAQRDNALAIPYAMMKKKLTLDEYISARPIADPIHLFDCVMPCAGAEAFLVCREDTAKSLHVPGVRILSTVDRMRTNGRPSDFAVSSRQTRNASAPAHGITQSNRWIGSAIGRADMYSSKVSFFFIIAYGIDSALSRCAMQSLAKSSRRAP
jgi:acetyl-CoA acetyltransferase